ncbi:hypothetical protein [Halocynthiibacter namhaensis]|uniref:hypothetical protein n=1 Tax=Halocynthiibacter namhaensis TaxID=1290553 RepID=UPI000579886C|nr:hypothetical protein [Halocynthiibacter namhaensis]
MKVMRGQVHIAELLLLAIVSLLAHAVGYMLPFIAFIVSVLWPIMLIQLVFEGALVGVFYGLRRLIFGRKEDPIEEAVSEPKREGIAAYIWLLPMIAVTAGYARHLIEMGRWLW